MTKYSAVIALLIFMLFSCSCGDTGPDAVIETAGTSGTVTENVPDEAQRIAYEPEVDYEGYEFRLINYDNATENEWTGIPNDLFVEAENGERLNDSVWRRNAAVSEALNIKTTPPSGHPSTEGNSRVSSCQRRKE